MSSTTNLKQQSPSRNFTATLATTLAAALLLALCLLPWLIPSPSAAVGIRSGMSATSQRPGDLHISGDSVTLAVTTGSSSIALPTDTGGAVASRVRVWVATGSSAAYFTLSSGAGTAVVATGFPLDDENGAVIVTTNGASHLNAITGSGTVTLVVTPLGR